MNQLATIYIDARNSAGDFITVVRCSLLSVKNDKPVEEWIVRGGRDDEYDDGELI